MSDKLYPWLEQPWQHLLAYIEQRRIPQALLINGLAGLGKQQLALHFSQLLLCQHKLQKTYCGQCESCKLFTSKTNPDFILVQPEEPGKAIGVDLIRNVIGKLALKPQYSAYRVVLITPVDQMNINSANAFLKCLEEPPERTVFILISEHMQHLPATIRSRCQKMLLAPPEKSGAILWLKRQGVSEQAQLLMNLAQGAPLKALTYAQENILEQRRECFVDWQNISMAKACPVQVAGKWYKLSPELLLPWIISWTEDVIKCYFQTDKCQMLNEDLEKHLRVLSKRLDLNRLFEFYSLLLKNTYRMHTTLNKQLLFEEMLITWSMTKVNK